MTGRKSIVVLFHSDRRLGGGLVTHLADYWREAGYDVEFVHGTKRFVDADLVLVHVNLSVVPKEYIDFANRYPIVLNGEITDIRKRSFSEILVGADDDWDGPVIVKADLNFAGMAERSLAERWLTRNLPFHRLRRAAGGLVGQTPPSVDPLRYAVYQSLADVPRPLFRDDRVVVEKFLAEVEDDLYHVRCYQFLGERGICHRIGAREPIVRGRNCVRRRSIEPHPDVLEWRQRLRIDYGKLDYVINDGRAVLLDINKTTGVGAFQDDPDLEACRRYRAAGIEAYFGVDRDDAPVS